MSKLVEINFDPDTKTLRQFGVIALVGFGVLAVLAYYEKLGEQLQHFLLNPHALLSLENNVHEVTSGFRHIVADYADIVDTLLDRKESV